MQLLFKRVFLLFSLIAVSFVMLPAVSAAENPLETAEGLVQAGNNREAEQVLLGYAKQAPKHWSLFQKEKNQTIAYFWDKAEFFSYIRYLQKQKKADQKITWRSGSYSRAYHLLAFLANERKDYLKALEYTDEGLRLEPDQPFLWTEKAFVFSKLGRYDEALQLNQKAYEVRPWATRWQRAMALRGQGIALIDLNRLDEAQQLLKRSLKWEPRSKTAFNELKYIDKLRRKASAAS